ncbi:TRAP transporter small permease subunit [Halodurantibacterium flavum]|uniref:TRAP transporter small permease protein n=1 Tax=Halodurantibacterium flavum TaxID=1382802 RepID=A0ABW4S1Y1_9RHOB
MRTFLARLTVRASDWAMALAEIGIALMMFHVVTEIVSRRLFRVSLDAVPEIVGYYYMASVIFLSLAYVTRAEGHVAATLFTDLLPIKVQSLLMGIVLVILGGVMTVFAWQMGIEAVRMTRIGEFHQGATLNLPTWPSRWFPPVGAVLMALMAFLMALDKLIGQQTVAQVATEDLPPEQQPEQQEEQLRKELA